MKKLLIVGLLVCGNQLVAMEPNDESGVTKQLTGLTKLIQESTNCSKSTC